MRRERFEDDDDATVKDGETIRVRLDLMDAIQREIASHFSVVDGVGRPSGHAPGHAYAAGGSPPGAARLGDGAALRDQALDAYEKRLVGAWRQPFADAVRKRDLQRHINQLHGAAVDLQGRLDTGEAAEAEQQREKTERGANAGDAADIRDSAYAAMVGRAENAWRGPR